MKGTYSTEQARRAAQLLFDAQKARDTFTALPDAIAPQTVAEAFQVQTAFQALKSAECGAVVGYKIALTTRVMQRMVGFNEPTPGAIFADTVHRSPASTACDAYIRLGVECEIAVRLVNDLPATDTPYTRDSVAQAVGEVMAAFELVDDRNADYEQLASSILTVLSENAWNAGVVLGQPLTDWRAADLGLARGVLELNGEPVADGVGADVMGHPLEALAWLANSQNARGNALRAGALVMTGSIIATRFVAAGDSMRFTVQGMPVVELNIT